MLLARGLVRWNAAPSAMGSGDCGALWSQLCTVALRMICLLQPVLMLPIRRKARSCGKF